MEARFEGEVPLARHSLKRCDRCAERIHEQGYVWAIGGRTRMFCAPCHSVVRAVRRAPEQDA